MMNKTLPQPTAPDSPFGSGTLTPTAAISALNGSKTLVKGETPASNTGLYSHRLGSGLSVRVDTLAVVLREVETLEDAQDIIDLLCQNFDEVVEFNPELPTTMGRRWDGHSTSSLRGLQLWWAAPTDEKPGELYIYAGGTTLAAATQRDTQDLYAYLAVRYRGECKRFDVALDDHEKQIPLDRVVSDVQAGNYAYVDSDEIISSGRRGEGQRGVTAYLGSARSDKRVRIYDKSVQTDGEIDTIRVETQFRDSKADLAFKGWIDYDAGAVDVGVPQYLAMLVMGAVRFCDRSSGAKNIERCPLLDWWQALTDRAAQPLRVPAKRVESSLEKSMAWVDTQVSRTLAKLKLHFGDAFNTYVEAVTTIGEERLRPRDLAIIQMESA